MSAKVKEYSFTLSSGTAGTKILPCSCSLPGNTFVALPPVYKRQIPCDPPAGISIIPFPAIVKILFWLLGNTSGALY
jgi:hypothetical protein